MTTALIIALVVVVVVAYLLFCAWRQAVKERNEAEAAANKYEAQARDLAAHADRQTRRIRHLQQRSMQLRDELETLTARPVNEPHRPPVLTDWSAQLDEIDRLPVTSPEDDR